MTTRYRPYPAYKDSGVEWLGKVPEHWNVVPFKWLAKIQNGADYKQIEVDDGGYPVIGSGGEFARAEKYVYNGESVLLGRKGTIDRPLYVENPFWVVDTMFYTVIRECASPKYLYYCALTIQFDRYSTNTALPSMTQETLGCIPFFIPEILDQRRIASHLDRETARIDALVEKKGRFLELLREKRQALITHAVTKGLDATVPLKDSGVEWLGQVPEHWAVKKILYWIDGYGSGTTPSSDGDYCDEGHPWVTTGELRENIVLTTEKCVTSRAIEVYSALRLHPMGSLVVAMYGATVGRLGMLGCDASLNQACFAIHPSRNVDVSLLRWWFEGFRMELIELATGAGQPNISGDKIRNLVFACPADKKEQAEILAVLDRETSRIDSLIEKTQRSIELLKERRCALITAAVTGQIDLREVCA